MRRNGLAAAGVVLLVVGVCGMLLGAGIAEWASFGGARASIGSGLDDNGRGLTAPGPEIDQGTPDESLPGTDSGGFASIGERIYFTGQGHAGSIPRSGGVTGGRGMMGRYVACADCHDQDGRGGTIRDAGGRQVLAPDIRYVTLTSARAEGGKSVPAWKDSQIATAIRTGATPTGEKLDPVMPRWDMDTTDMKALIGYLKELSGT